MSTQKHSYPVILQQKIFGKKITRYIYNLLIENGPMTRDDIVRLTNLPRTTIYDHLVKLMIKGMVEKYSLITNKRGRPPVYYRITNKFNKFNKFNKK